jgi:hypothetical protein
MYPDNSVENIDKIHKGQVDDMANYLFSKVDPIWGSHPKK